MQKATADSSSSVLGSHHTLFFAESSALVLAGEPSWEIFVLVRAVQHQLSVHVVVGETGRRPVLVLVGSPGGAAILTSRFALNSVQRRQMKIS